MAIEFGSRKETFENFKVYETTLAGRPFKVEMGKMCGLSNACLLYTSCAPLRVWMPVPLPAVWAAAATPVRRAVSCWATLTTPRARSSLRWKLFLMHRRRKHDAGDPHC